jgi:CRP-like cAMP-binding protein
MATMIIPRELRTMPSPSLDRLMALAREVSFAADESIFEEGQEADRFWIVRTGSVSLDLGVPGRWPASVETVGPEDLLGWSWLFPPYEWHLSASAFSPVRALEFDAAAVRELCAEDPWLGQTLTRYVAQVMARRLQAARSRLADLYETRGGGWLM